MNDNVFVGVSLILDALNDSELLSLAMFLTLNGPDNIEDFFYVDKIRPLLVGGYMHKETVECVLSINEKRNM